MLKNKTGLRVATFILNAFWRSLRALNLFLFFLLFLQCFIAILFWSNLKISLPKKGVDFLRDEIASMGVEANFSNVTVDIKGNFSIDSLRLRFNGTPKDFLSAKKITVSFWLPKLFRGDFTPLSIRVLDANLASTFSGVDGQSALSSLYADIRSEGSWWHIDALSTRVGKLRITASGYVNSNFNPDSFFEETFDSLEQKETKSKSTSDFSAKKWDSIFENYPKLKSIIDQFADPMIGATFSLYGGTEDSVVLTFVSSGTSVAIKNEIANIENIRLKFSHKNLAGKSSSEATLLAKNFSFKGYDASFKNISAHSDVAIAKDSIALKNLDVSIKRIFFDGSEIGNVRIAKDFLSNDAWDGEWRFFVARDICRIGGAAELSKNFDVAFGIEGRVDAHQILSRKELVEIPELKQFSFPYGIYIDVTGNFFAKDKRANLVADVEAQNCVVMNIPVKSLHGDVFFDSQTSLLEAKNLRVKTGEGWSVNGEYIQNFATNGYFVRVLGNLRPMAIAHFMEPWWTRVMKDFNFVGDNNFPRADVLVEGTWGAPENIWCFASASGANAEYHGANFTGFSLNVLVNPQRISLYDVLITSPSGRAKASIDWLYGKDGLTTFNEQKIYMHSSLSSNEIIALGGDDAKEVLDVVRFENPPNLLFNASMRNPSNNPDKLPDVFNASVNSNGITRIEMAALENFAFTARSNVTHTEVDDISAKFCGGVVIGKVNLERKNKSMDFDANLDADKMNQKLFTEFLMSLGGEQKKENSDKENEEKKKKSLVDGGENGEVTMSIALKGNTSEFEKCAGKGVASLENKDLVKLNLLGMLSRALAALRLPLGAFDVTYAKSSFEISDGIVKFPELELGGPVMKIQGAANYNFIKDYLESSLSVAPFGGLKAPVVSQVVSIITPLTNVVQVNLEGELADPKIGVSVTPSNIIRSEEGVVEKIRDEL